MSRLKELDKSRVIKKLLEGTMCLTTFFVTVSVRYQERLRTDYTLLLKLLEVCVGGVLNKIVPLTKDIESQRLEVMCVLLSNPEKRPKHRFKKT